MKSKAVISFILAMTMITAPSFAQEHANRREQAQAQRHERQRQVHQRNHRPNRQVHQRQRAHYPPHHEFARGAGPDHAYYPGARLAREYHTRQYVVDDWRGHRLSAPPRGYHWVQVGGDYVLVAIATGIILNLMLGN